MKRFLLAALLSLAFVLPSTGQYLFTNTAELAEMQRRASGIKAVGPFATLGDAFTNSPNDWQRIKSTADAFLSNPLAAGNTSAMNLQIWTGGTVQGQNYPFWQGHGAACAALASKVTGNQAYAQAVRQSILFQVRLGGNTNLGNWAVPNNANVSPTYENGAQESQWLKRLGIAFDYSKDVFTVSERQEFLEWYTAGAWYLANRIHSALATSLPLRRQNNWATRAYFAAPNGFPPAGWEDPIYERDDKNVYPDLGGWRYTHRKADGTAGNKVSRHAQSYNNRLWIKAGYIYLAGRLAGDTALVWEAKCIYRESLAFGVYPDGTVSDFERNGNYNIAQQGLVYSCYFYEFAAMLADGEARRGNYEIYNYSTRDGSHGSQCTTGQPTKTFFTPLDRLRDCVTGANPIYGGTVALANRIDDYSESTKQFLPFTYVLATPGRWKVYNTPSDTSYQVVAYRSANNTLKYPTKGFFAAGTVGQVFGGSGLEFPGYNFMFGKMEAIEPYGRADGWPVIAQAQTVQGPVRSVALKVDAGGRAPVQMYWRQVGGSPIRLSGQDLDQVLVSSNTPLAPIPTGTYSIRVFAKDAAGIRVEKAVELTVAP